jgi:NitT/TauT family transport system permease protein
MMDSERTSTQQGTLALKRVVPGEGTWQNRAWKVIRTRYEYLLIPVSVVLFVGAWQAIIDLGSYPEYILPSPGIVWNRFLISLPNGELFFHARVTLSEALSGFALGLAFATVLGYILGRWPPLEKVVSPYLVAAKSIPVLGIAPLLIIWFGQGLTAKALIAFLIIFFPMLVNTIVGIRGVKEEQRELMRSYSASGWQVFATLEVPSALPILLGGIKVGLARSMMGAIVGEYIGSKQGLGFLVNMGTGGGAANAPLTFLGIFSIVIITTILYGLSAVLESVLLAGRRRKT